MSKKNLEVIELNKKEEEIILEEKQSSFSIFWNKNRFRILAILLILSLITFIGSSFLFLSNIYKSLEPNIKEITLESTLSNYNKYVMSGDTPITEKTAQNKFLNGGDFKAYGEVLTVKVIESGTFVIKFYSDGTALKIMKKGNVITRINPLENGQYGISERGITNIKAITRDVSLTSTKTYPWGVVSYFSDGSADITDSKYNMFVRNAKDINNTYISNNKVAYLKDSKKIGNNQLNYYYDGTIEVIRDNKSYLVRNEKDLEISSNNVSFKNHNEATIYQSKKMSNGIIIDYYQDGGAIIRNGTRTISIRKSNSIIINDNNIYEIVDSIYVTVSKTLDNGKITYYTNGGSVFEYNNKTYYTDENSNLKYQNNQLSKIEGSSEELSKSTNIESEKVLTFEKTAVIETKDYIAIVPKDSILYNKDGTIKEITTSASEDNNFTITNNTNEKLKYRIVIEESKKTNLLTKYLRYQLQVNETYSGIKRMDESIWNLDSIGKQLDITGTNYILLDSEIEPHDTKTIRLMLWTDYDTIPNSMQNKYFYGTIKVYAWTEKNK